MPPEATDHKPAAAVCFEQTRWSMVVAATGGDSTQAQKALAHLCETYWYPLYAFVRRTGSNSHDAQDLTQEFFARLLEKNWLGGVDRSRGRFRSWLLASMKHFLANEWDKSQARKRGCGQVLLSLDGGDAESRYAHEPVDHTSADKLFDRRWALSVLDTVLGRLRDEFSAGGKGELFEALKPALTGEKSPYAEIGTRLGMSEGAVKVAVHRLRERYRELIRSEIVETVAAPDEVDDELRHLLAVLSA